MEILALLLLFMSGEFQHKFPKTHHVPTKKIRTGINFWRKIVEGGAEKIYIDEVYVYCTFRK